MIELPPFILYWKLVRDSWNNQCSRCFQVSWSSLPQCPYTLISTKRIRYANTMVSPNVTIACKYLHRRGTRTILCISLLICLTECPYQGISNHSTSDNPSFTFKQLYRWPASIDLIERYEDYLNQPSQSRCKQRNENDVLYNCTWPRFRPFAATVVQGVNFSQYKTEKRAKYASLSLIVMICGTTFYDPLNRCLIE